MTIGSVQSILDYLINLIKSRSNVKNTPKQASVLPNVQATTMEFKKTTVVRSFVNPDKIRRGNTNFEMDYNEYCTILQRSSHLPTTFAVNLVSTLFTDNELFEKNVTGKCHQSNIQRSKFNPQKLDAIIKQLNPQFPNFMESKENREKIWNAINGKCRKTTEKN